MECLFSDISDHLQIFGVCILISCNNNNNNNNNMYICKNNNNIYLCKNI